MIVQPYNPEWPRMFRQMQDFLAGHLDGAYMAIEHVGSTSVPGMTAKPIIDIDVVHEGRWEEIRDRLIAAGYEHCGDQGIPGREAFRLPDAVLSATLPAHHLYVTAVDAAELHRHRAFRDFLRSHPEWIERLSAHKLEIASQLADDRDARDAYQEAKAAMVEDILAFALHEAEESPLLPGEG